MRSSIPARSLRGPRSRFPGDRPLGWLGASLAGCLILSGCGSPDWRVASMAPDYHPENVFLYSSTLSPDLKRVVVLPVACEGQRPDLGDGCEAMDPIFKAEVVKSGKFEVVSATPETLQNATGRSSWTGAEQLPQQFFDSLHDVYACDAVLFCQLTVFRPYPPLAVGWRLKLVSVQTRQILWAADELFDAGKPSVMSGAEAYQRGGGLHLFHDDHDEWLMSHSYRQFGQYAAAEVLQTLPSR